jgi:hypothetical protein
MRHLEQLGAELCRLPQQPGLGGHLGIPGQEHGTVLGADPDDDRALVQVERQRAVRRW